MFDNAARLWHDAGKEARMASVVLNTLEYAKRLEAAGFTRQQAEA